MLVALEPKDINNRARTLLGDISSWSGASSLLVRGHRILQLDGVSVRLPTAASLDTHRQAARIAPTRPPPLSTFFRGRGIVRSQKTRAKNADIRDAGHTVPRGRGGR